MAVSYSGFLIELYEEYLSDGGFVATQRENLLADPCGVWTRLEHWEDRLEAYIDGLCVGGDLALEVCRRRAIEGEPGELHCALRVFHRQARPDLIEQVLSEETNRAPKRIDIIGNALKHERGNDMCDVVRRLFAFDPNLIAPLSKIVGHQRLALSALLVNHRALTSCPSLTWALGRLRSLDAATSLRGIPRREEEDTVATLALLRILNYLDPLEDWPLIAFGIMGKHGHVHEMLDPKDAHSSLALGLLGQPSTVPELIGRLPHPQAALALQLITGAGLTGEKAVDDEILEPGERPTTIKEISCDPSIWTDWWNHHRAEFTDQIAFRSGLPYSAETLSAALRNPSQMNIERYWTAEQLAVRHQMALAFEVNMPVREQIEILDTMT